jgi:hypothetical protein
MPTDVDVLAHLSIHDFTHVNGTVEVNGNVDVGTAARYHLTPVRLVLRRESWEADLDRALKVLSLPALKAKLAAEMKPPVRVGPRRKTV